ncbi:hypothetical protein [Paenibacillus massiliensis]|uniref:hypothetical protein n=1 Tax=Paenibacillus massiliensis TaxID=225917 RepID=UPI00046F4D1C|nr:hypothetical protein [Paenibacillus massiliensis]
MNRAEAMDHFREHYIDVHMKYYIHKLEEEYRNQFQERSAEFVESFRRICKLAKAEQDQGIKGAIGYITFSMRRTYLLHRQYDYVVQAFDRNWYFDAKPCEDRYDAGWVWTCWHELGEQLESRRKLYMDRLLQPEVEQVHWACIPDFHEYVMRLGAECIGQAVKLLEFAELELEEELEIRIGEYKGISKVIYSICEESLLKEEELMDWF